MKYKKKGHVGKWKHKNASGAYKTNGIRFRKNNFPLRKKMPKNLLRALLHGKRPRYYVWWTWHFKESERGNVEPDDTFEDNPKILKELSKWKKVHRRKDRDEKYCFTC
jgi:hypothetical protein